MYVLDGLTLDGIATLDHGGRLDFQGTQALGGTGSIAFGPDEFIDQYGDMVNNYVAIDSTGTTASTLTIGPSVTVGGQSGIVASVGTSGGDILNTGTIASSKSILIEVTNFDNEGTVEASAGSQLDFNIAPTNLSAGTLTGGTWSIGPDSTLDLDGRTVTTNDATIILDGPGASFIAMTQLATNAAGGSLELLDGASFKTAGNLDNAGTIQLSPGTLTAKGTFTQESTGALDIGVGGLAAGSQFGQLAVTGQASLAGDLNISVLDGYSPALGTGYGVMTFPAMTGNFAVVTGLNLGGGIAFVPSFNATNIDLIVGQANPFLVTDLADSGLGSLRAAIIAVDVDSIANGNDQIAFAGGIQGGTISLLSPLPALTRGQVMITGPITLDGNSASGDGLDVSGEYDSIQGLTVTGFSARGISLSGNNDSVTASTVTDNGGDGITITGSGSTIGGTTSGAGNIIAFNGSNGVTVGLNVLDAALENAVLGNAIFSNTGLGIAVSNTAPQAAPVLTSAISGGSQTTITGTVTGAPNSTFRIEFFSNPAGTSQGETYLGFLSVTTDGGGSASFSFTPASTVAPGLDVTATATDPGGNTSEFSPAVTVQSNVTGDLSVKAGGFVFNRSTRQFSQTLTITNISGAPITGPIELVLLNLKNATLANQTGEIQGVPYITVLSSGSLGIGQSITITLVFNDPTLAPITYIPEFLAGPIPTDD